MGGTERATAAARHRCRRAAAIRSEWQKFYLKLRFFSSWPWPLCCILRGAAGGVAVVKVSLVLRS